MQGFYWRIFSELSKFDEPCWRLEKEMATHSSILTWRIPWTEEPGGLLLMGSQTVRHKWVTKQHADVMKVLCLYGE